MTRSEGVHHMSWVNDLALGSGIPAGAATLAVAWGDGGYESIFQAALSNPWYCFLSTLFTSVWVSLTLMATAVLKVFVPWFSTLISIR